MSIDLGNVDASSTLYIPFQTFDSNGASVTLTGLAVTDIEIYKNGSTTQRSSDAGYTLLDTDGIDFDGITGIHGFSIDLSDNTDAGFYAAGSFYWVVVSSVTVDTRTVNFIAATFRIGPAAVNATQILGTAISTPAAAGILDVNVKNIDNDAASASGTVTFPNATLASTTNITAGTITTTTNLTNLPAITANWLTAAGIAAGALDGKGNWNIGKTGYALTATTGLGNQTADITGSLSGAVGSVTGAVGSVTGNVGGNVAGSVGSVTGAVGSVTGAVGSVTGAVGSVTGNVGGNVVGSVASVTAAVAITSNVKKNQALAKFEFMMTDATTHAPLTGATVTVTRSIDGAAFGAGTLSAVTEVSNGIYYVDFGSGDLNGNVITLRATAAGADDTFSTVITQP